MTETITHPPIAPDPRPDTTESHDDAQPRVLHVPGFHDKFVALAANTMPAAAGGHS